MSTAFLRLGVCCLLAVTLGASPLGAQSTSGTIQGVVLDNQGGVVPGATVTARNVDTNVSRSVATDAGGVYRFLRDAAWQLRSHGGADRLLPVRAIRRHAVS